MNLWGSGSSSQPTGCTADRTLQKLTISRNSDCVTRIKSKLSLFWLFSECSYNGPTSPEASNLRSFQAQKDTQKGSSIPILGSSPKTSQDEPRIKYYTYTYIYIQWSCPWLFHVLPKHCIGPGDLKTLDSTLVDPYPKGGIP